jgi:hypothetical protein
LWSQSSRATRALLERVLTWDYQTRGRFLDHLTEALTHRLGVGKIEPRQWILLAMPEDVARAAVLTVLSGV